MNRQKEARIKYTYINKACEMRYIIFTRPEMGNQNLGIIIIREELRLYVCMLIAG